MASELPPSKLSIEGGRGADICALPWQLNTTPLTSQENARLTAIIDMNLHGDLGIFSDALP